MTNTQIENTLRGIEAQLESIHRVVLAIRESILPDLTAIIRMHQGQRLGTETEDDT